MAKRHHSRLLHDETGREWNFETVAKYFDNPIVEASEKTGLKPSVLKRICHENGLARWPFRKIQAGKTVEEVVASAKREMEARAVREAAERAQPSHAGSTPGAPGSRPGDMGATKGGIRGPMRPVGGVSPGADPRASDSDKGRQPFVGESGLRAQPRMSPVFIPFAPPNSASVRPRNTRRQVLPSYADEFRFGFPTGGLATSGTRWWGPEPPPNLPDAPSGSGEPLPAADPRRNAAASSPPSEQPAYAQIQNKNASPRERDDDGMPSKKMKAGEGMPPEALRDEKEEREGETDYNCGGGAAIATDLVKVLEGRCSRTKHALEECFLRKGKSVFDTMWHPADQRESAFVRFVFGDYFPCKWEPLSVPRKRE